MNELYDAECFHIYHNRAKMVSYSEGLTVDEAVLCINDRAHGCVKMINAVQNSGLIDN